MYPPHPKSISTFIAPVYPLFAGGVSALVRIGHSTPFPSGSALGHNCNKAVLAEVHWSQATGAVFPTMRVGYLTWVFLLLGLVWLLRAAGRGRCGWEPTTLIIVACLPPVWMCVEMYTHPQDIVALGLALAAVACALRNHWIGAGILVALAVLSQQYALLVAVPLLVVAPAKQRVPFLGAAVITAAVIAVPLLVVTSGAAGRPLFLGSGDSAGFGGTVIWETHLAGAPLVLVSRVLPLVLSLLLAWWVVRRVGRSVLQPAILVSLVAVCLSFRLVFEQNIFAYYYMALAVSLILLDVISGRIRERLVAWLAMVTLIYSEDILIVWRQSWGQSARHWIPLIVLVVSLLFIIRHVLHHTLGWDVVLWGGAIVCALVIWPISSDPLRHQPVTWLWQAILVAIGVALAAGPLLRMVREHSSPPGVEQPEQLAPASAGAS